MVDLYFHSPILLVACCLIKQKETLRFTLSRPQSVKFVEFIDNIIIVIIFSIFFMGWDWSDWYVGR
jgi:hypothetical protein